MYKRQLEECGDKKAVERDVSPGSKHIGKGIREADDDLSKDDRKQFRSIAALVLYLAADRPDIQQAVSAIMRGMASPKVLDQLRLRRLAAYLSKYPELTWWFDYNDNPDHTIYVEVDADWAGQELGRKSCDGGFEFVNGQLIDGWSTVQQTVALSSGESELNGICNGAARGLWTKALLTSMQFEFKLRVSTDSSAAKGITSRLGTGRVRHLETRCLWIQQLSLIHI